MLKHQPWIHYAPDMMTEWMQCMEEGLDVESYRPICEKIAASPAGWDTLAWEIAEKMHAAPVREGYPYDEPSGYEEILAKRPAKRHTFQKPDPDALRDKLKGAWTGRIAGCLLGKPVEGMRRPQLYALLGGTDNYPMHKYICKKDFTDEVRTKANVDDNRCWADNLGGIEPVDDDTNYTVFGLKLLESRGWDFTPADVMECWLSFIPFLNLCTAERAAYRNGAMGLLPPETASYQNPFREWIGAQIRGDFFGYICAGDPEKGAALAWRDASISHVKNGIYGEMYCTAMTAAAAVCDDIMTVIEAGLDEIPAACRLRHDVELVIGWYREGLNREQIIEKIHETYNENTAHGWCHTNSNAMIVTMALLLGGGDFEKSVCGAVQAAFDTDCNGATVGSIVGMLRGYDALPKIWSEPFKDGLYTSIQGYNLVTVDTLVEKTAAVMKHCPA